MSFKLKIIWACGISWLHTFDFRGNQGWHVFRRRNGVYGMLCQCSNDCCSRLHKGFRRIYIQLLCWDTKSRSYYIRSSWRPHDITLVKPKPPLCHDLDSC